ncbi:mitochondrial ribosomal protein L37-domain-containing protein [Xylariaceae sp. FL0662B]|nr:mitochondrial ribosomal protein L37-domain-containing protein [Xylariaceae sp. FL0662B]
MICRRCLQRASALRSVVPKAPTTTTNRRPSPFLTRPISSTSTSAAPASSPAPQSQPSSEKSEAAAAAPVFSTPLADSAAGGGSQEKPPPLSSCPEGTILAGLNYFKNRTDPIALADDAYPAWLWDCLKVMKKADDAADDDAGDEYSKSKKQRRLAAKKQRAHEAKLLAEGNLEALAPKVPLPHQTINLPANEDGSVKGAIEAQAAREELRKAMRKERKAKIKESNYLKSM